MTFPIKQRINTELIGNRGFILKRGIKKRVEKLSAFTEEVRLILAEK